MTPALDPNPQVGDVAEVNAVKSVFSDWSGIKMNATKSMIGHCLGAAGGLEAVATIMAIRTGESGSGRAENLHHRILGRRSGASAQQRARVRRAWSVHG